MVKLNDQQQRAVEAVSRAKQHYDDLIEQAEAELRLYRSRLKEPIREAVRAAAELGTPERQIHVYGLGMQQRNQMHNFLMTPELKESDADRFRKSLYQYATDPAAPTGLFGATVATVPWEFTVVVRDRQWRVVSPTGDVYSVNVFPTSYGVVFRPNVGVDTPWTPENNRELVDAILANKPDWITQAQWQERVAQDEEE